MFPYHKKYLLCLHRQVEVILISKNDRLPGFILNSLCNCGLLTVSLLCADRGSPSHLYFPVRNSLQTQSRENLRMFAWHKNYALCRHRKVKVILISQKRRSSGLPIEFCCVPVGFQWSSYCVKTVEVCHTYIFS